MLNCALLLYESSSVHFVRRNNIRILQNHEGKTKNENKILINYTRQTTFMTSVTGIYKTCTQSVLYFYSNTACPSIIYPIK